MQLDYFHFYYQNELHVFGLQSYQGLIDSIPDPQLWNYQLYPALLVSFLNYLDQLVQ